ncbi:MAG TPA: hypothetical protein VEB20_08465 [Azospirillaceae bacterium]|nr:hypothetical protein [Azospirillaceae bacterium]
MSATEAPIACSLDGTSLTLRIAWIRTMQRRFLAGHRREGPTLHLAFAGAARAEVEELMRREKACCGFLEFRLADAGGLATLSITVPPAAAAAADEMLSPFMPEPRDAAPGPPSCGCPG